MMMRCTLVNALPVLYLLAGGISQLGLPGSIANAA